MKTIIICISILLLYPSLSWAEVGGAVKLGYVEYSEERPSEYTGNNCYDSEMAYGGFVRWVKDKWIVRADVDYNKTGNTFQNSIPYPYEQIELRQTNYSLTMGKYFSYLYLLGGVCYTNNYGEIEQYPANPFDYEFKDSWGKVLIVGIEKGEKVFLFLEGKYTWQDLEVLNITEDVDRLGVYAGIGVNF